MNSSECWLKFRMTACWQILFQTCKTLKEPCKFYTHQFHKINCDFILVQPFLPAHKISRTMYLIPTGNKVHNVRTQARSWEFSGALCKRQVKQTPFVCWQKQVGQASDPSSSEAVDRDASVWLIHFQDPEQRPEIDLTSIRSYALHSLHAMAKGLMLPGKQRKQEIVWGLYAFWILLAKLIAILLLSMHHTRTMKWLEWQQNA